MDYTWSKPWLISGVNQYLLADGCFNAKPCFKEQQVDPGFIFAFAPRTGFSRIACEWHYMHVGVLFRRRTTGQYDKPTEGLSIKSALSILIKKPAGAGFLLVIFNFFLNFKKLLPEAQRVFDKSYWRVGGPHIAYNQGTVSQ